MNYRWRGWSHFATAESENVSPRLHGASSRINSAVTTPNIMAKIDTPPGFEDFLPEELNARNYLFETWRKIAMRYGFVEYETPIIEFTDLYRKKSGDEIVSELFSFTDRGKRDLALRPEVTPSLARLASQNQRNYSKPLKWFEIGSCFRAESPQRGRRREFIQFNNDIVGESSPAADAELIAMLIDVMREFGFTSDDVKIRLSDRKAWDIFLAGRELPTDALPKFLSALDKLEKDPEGTEKKLGELGIDVEEVRAFIANPTAAAELFNPITDSLAGRGLADFVQVDLSIVRGLAYYTGAVFELFSLKGKHRAIAGGGRYDQLLALMSNGKVDLPAVGYAMGNVVILDLIRETAEPLARLEEYLTVKTPADIFVIVADEAERAAALSVVQKLRDADISTDFPLTPAKIDKQFKMAEKLGTKFAVIIGSEFPEISIKNLTTREETKTTSDNLIEALRQLLDAPDSQNLLA